MIIYFYGIRNGDKLGWFTKDAIERLLDLEMIELVEEKALTPGLVERYYVPKKAGD